MPRKYKRLSYEDRKTIEEMCRNGKKADEIAEAMDVHRATIYHELQRGGAGGYMEVESFSVLVLPGIRTDITDNLSCKHNDGF